MWTMVSLLSLLWLQPSLAIGWRFELVRDPSRVYAPADGDLGGPPGRPVAITLWYPAARVSRAPSSLEDFARLDAFRAYGNPPATAADEALAQAVQATAPTMLARTTRSVRDAPVAGGRFPLVLFAHSSPLGQIEMAQDLARTVSFWRASCRVARRLQLYSGCGSIVRCGFLSGTERAPTFVPR
jgi:hypothetical protein